MKQLVIGSVVASPMEHGRVHELRYDPAIQAAKLTIANEHMVTWRPDRWCPSCHHETVAWEDCNGVCTECGNLMAYDTRNGYRTANVTR